MADGQTDNFAEALAEITDVSTETVLTPDNQDAAPESEAPVVESLSDEDKPATDPEAKDESTEAPAEDAATSDQAKGKSEGAEEDPEYEVEIDGEKQTVKLSELRQGYLRRADYTQKTQSLAERERQVESSASEVTQLVSDIGSDKDMSEFLRAHPEALKFLVQDPTSTRALLGNPEAIEEFWQDFEVISANPRIAERLTKGDSQAMEQEKVAQGVSYVANNLQYAVNTVAERYPDADKEAVSAYVLELGGITKDASPEQLVAGFNRLRNIFFVNTPEGERIDSQLIADRFESLSVKDRASEERAAVEAETHNKQVDLELQREKDAPPATPDGDSTPAAAAPKVKSYEQFQDAIADILGN